MKRWLIRFLNRMLDRLELEKYPEDDCVPLACKDITFNTDYKEFRIYNADGGHVIEVYQYRRNKDSENSLHIIRSDQQLGEEIEKILLLKELKS